MIKPLRTYHFYLWRIWVVLLPLGFILALWVIPRNQTSVHPSSVAIKGETTLVYHAPSPCCDFNLRQTTGVPGYQLELVLKKQLKVPACLVYLRTDKDQLIGQLGQVGTYYFDLPSALQHFDEATITLQDPIHQQVITTIQLPL